MSDSSPGVPDRVVAGRYRLVRELGRGGMGVVWLAEDELVGRPVAVKELRAPQGLSQAERETYGQRALQEARSAAHIDHPGVVTLYDVLPASTASDAVYLIMELCEGPTLAQLIQRSGMLPPSDVARFGLQLLSVLQTAHALGIVHRDIKPANIIIARGGQLKLADFGIAHTLGDARLTRSGVMGTQAYLAPELFDAAPITPAADVWSLGATLYAAAEGRGPFDRDTTGATLRAILVDDVPTLRCPPPLAAAILGMLQRDPARRATLDQARTQLLQAVQPVAQPSALQQPTSSQAAATPPPHPASDPATSILTPAPRPAPASPAPWEMAATSRWPSAPPPVTPSPAPQPPPPGRPRRAFIIGGVAAAVAVAAAIAVPVLLSGNHQNSPAPQPTPPASPSGPQPAAALVDPGGSGAAVDSIAFNPRGQTLAVGDNGGSTYVWDVATAKEVATLPGVSSTAGVDSIAFSPDGQTLAVGDGNDSTYLWNVTSHSMVASLLDSGTVNTAVDAVAFSSDGRTVASGDLNGSTYLWDVASHSTTATLADPAGSTGGVTSVAFSPNGQTLAVGDGNDSTYLWSMATRQIVATLADPGGKNADVDSVAFSPDGQTLAVGDGDGRTYLWNVAGHSMTATLTEPAGGSSSVNSVAFSPDGKLVAAGCKNARTYLFDVATGQLTTTRTDPDGLVSADVAAVAFSPDGKTLATGDADNLTFLWHISS